MLKVSNADYQHFEETIQKAESITSAPIHLYFCHQCHRNPMVTAKKIFKELRLFANPNQNTILIVIGKKNQRFAIIGDKAAHQALSESAWQACSDKLGSDLKSGNYIAGIDTAINTLANALSAHFPA